MGCSKLQTHSLDYQNQKLVLLIMSLRNNKLFTDLEYCGLCKVQYGFNYCEGVQNPISGSDDKCFICRTVVEGEQW